MSERREWHSWGGPPTPEQVAAGTRRERRRRWVRVHSITVVVVVVAIDAFALAAITGAISIYHARAGRPCATFWAGIAHETAEGFWAVVVLLVVTTLLSAWRRWILVATFVVQVTAAAVLLPSIAHTRSLYTAVAEGRLAPVQVDSGGRACDAVP